MNKRGIILFVFFAVVLAGGVMGANLPPSPPPVPVENPADCNIQNTPCVAPFYVFGKVSNEGHFAPISNSLSEYPYYLCCKNIINAGKGAVSFKFTYFSPTSNGSGMVSVNASTTKFKGIARLGFQDSCYLKDNCDNNLEEICIFKIRSDTPYTAESSHIGDCDNPNVPSPSNTFDKELCCKFKEICNDGVNNDLDEYIDCADSDCYNWELTNKKNPPFCTGSYYDEETCILSYEKDMINGGADITYNPACYGGPPNPAVGGYYFYCGYPRGKSTPGLCCPSGKYPFYDIYNEEWNCVNSELCGIVRPEDECNYDIDIDFGYWIDTIYNPYDETKWCNSKIPNYYTPEEDNMPYPERSTGCCLLQKEGTVDYFTDEENVKIFGYQSYCGDDVVDAGEECDGPLSVTCKDFLSPCDPGEEMVGSPKCTNCVLSQGSCACVPSINGGGGQSPT